MAKRIFKYELTKGFVKPILNVEIPVNSFILDIQEQNGEIVLWALVDEEEKRIQLISYHVIGTGHSVNPSFAYVKTVQMSYGLVWHLFKEA